jgi:hypothetical protein
MEALWSPAVATAGNRWQMGGCRERLRQWQFIAVGCDRLPESFHGKEGVDGSSPSEGSAKAPQIGVFLFRISLRETQCAVGMEPFYGAFSLRDARNASRMAVAIASRRRPRTYP